MLTATNGSIGSLAGGTAAAPGANARPLFIDTGDTSTSTLSATAKTDVSVEETTGDLRVAKIAGAGSIFQGVTSLTNIVNVPAGEVRVVVDAGNLIDADTLQEADPRTQTELETLWANMTATVSTAQASTENTIQAYDAQQTRNYQTYWQYRNQQPNPSVFDPNFQVTLSDAQIAALTNYYTTAATPTITNVVVNGTVNSLALGSANPFPTGAAVVYRDHGNPDNALDGSGTLVDGQTYYVIASDTDASLDGTRIELALTKAAALAGNAIDLSSLATVSGTQTVGYEGSVLTTFVQTAITTIENDQTTQYRTLNTTYGKLSSSYDPNYVYHANDTSIATQTFGSSAVNTSTSVITLPANSLLTGQAVVYRQGSGTIANLVDGMTYYVVSLSSNGTQVEIALSYDDATAATPVTITLSSASGSGMMLIPAGAYQGFNATAVNTTAFTIDLPGNTFTTGQPVVYHQGSHAIANLTDGQVYYVIVSNTDPAEIQLASTYANAIASTPTPIQLSSASGTGAWLTPQSLFQTFSASAVNSTLHTVDLPNHVFTTGMAVVYHAVNGSIANLVDGITYYVIVSASNTANIQLAASFADATAGTPIAIQIGSATGSGMYFSEVDVLAWPPPGRMRNSRTRSTRSFSGPSRRTRLRPRSRIPPLSATIFI